MKKTLQVVQYFVSWNSRFATDRIRGSRSRYIQCRLKKSGYTLRDVHYTTGNDYKLKQITAVGFSVLQDHICNFATFQITYTTRAGCNPRLQIKLNTSCCTFGLIHNLR